MADRIQRTKTPAAVFIIIVLLTAIFMISGETAEAATASMSLAGGGTVEKGSNVSITLKYSGATFGSATASVSYDSSVLEFVSCSGGEAGGGGGNVKVTMANGTGTKALSATLTFKALKAGTSNITATTSDIYNIDLEELSAGSRSTSVTVKSSQTAVSSNNNLKYMYVSAGTLSPAFSPSVTSYKVNVGHNVTTCLITAECESAKATLAVTGSSSLKVGSNTRKVTVTAENGAAKTYTITINRAAEGENAGDKDDEIKPQDNETQDKEPQKPEAIETVVGGKTFIIEEDLADIEIPKGFSIAEANCNDKKIPVIKTADGKISMGLLREKDADDIGGGKWFFYAESKNMFYAKKSMSAEQLAAYGSSVAELAEKTAVQPEENEAEAEKKGGIEITSENIIYYVLGLTLGLLFIAVIVLQVQIMRNRK